MSTLSGLIERNGRKLRFEYYSKQNIDSDLATAEFRNTFGFLEDKIEEWQFDAGHDSECEGVMCWCRTRAEKGVK